MAEHSIATADYNKHRNTLHHNRLEVFTRKSAMTRGSSRFLLCIALIKVPYTRFVATHVHIVLLGVIDY